MQRVVSGMAFSVKTGPKCSVTPRSASRPGLATAAICTLKLQGRTEEEDLGGEEERPESGAERRSLAMGKQRGFRGLSLR